MENSVYSWTFSDKKNKGKVWYIVAISIVIALVIWGIFTKQYGFSFVMFLLSGVYLFVENNSEDEVQVSINDNGIKLGDTFYEFSSIQSYGFVFKKEHPMFLQFLLKKRGLKSLHIGVDNESYKQSDFLLAQRLEKQENASLTKVESLIHFLKL